MTLKRAKLLKQPNICDKMSNAGQEKNPDFILTPVYNE